MDTEQSLRYILYEHCYYYIEQLVWDVINDSEQDPEYSAVTASNLIKAYITVRNSLEDQSVPLDVIPFLKQRFGLSEDEIAKFERIRIKESEYYIGEIF